MSKRNSEKLDAFGNSASPDEVAKEIYGDNKSSALDTGVVRAKPTPINTIWADLSQPRRAVPTSVRGRWSGDPDELKDLLEHWRVMAEGESGKRIDVAKVLKNQMVLTVEDGAGDIYSRFAKLTALAASIRLEGLTNPVTIVRNGDMYRIETGERRWLAHHLLAMHIDEKKFGKVLAREVEFNPFRQASENLARDGFNAIEMARQIALLIMGARRDMDGVKYDSLEDLVLLGECDRRFYAQVANGNVHRIPPGMGEKISHATGLSEARFSQYRRLLAPTEDDELNDKFWIEADANGWTEHFIRETYLPSLKPKEETLTAVKVGNGDEDETTPNNAPSTPETKSFTPPNRDSFGKEFPAARPSPFGQANVVGNDGEIGSPHENLKGKKVRLRDGREGTIWEDKGGEKLMFLKTGATISNEVYRSAVASVMTGGNDSPPAHNPQTSQDEVSKPVIPLNRKLVDEALMIQVLIQARYMAEAMGQTGAANSLNVLTSITLADIRKMAESGSVVEVLTAHYNTIGGLLNDFMSRVEVVLQDWAAIDAAERQG